jgi:hypothetical protein
VYTHASADLLHSVLNIYSEGTSRSAGLRLIQIIHGILEVSLIDLLNYISDCMEGHFIIHPSAPFIGMALSEFLRRFRELWSEKTLKLACGHYDDTHICIVVLPNVVFRVALWHVDTLSN